MEQKREREAARLCASTRKESSVKDAQTTTATSEFSAAAALSRTEDYVLLFFPPRCATHMLA